MARKQSNRQKTEADPQLVQRLADAAARKLLDRALEYSEMIEHAEEEWLALARHYAATEGGNLSDCDRESDADKRAFYAIGLAIGRLTGGLR